MKNIYLKTLLAGLALAICSIANATLILDAGASSTEQNFTGGNYVAGTEFTLSTSLTIDGLAFIDIGSDGLTEDHLVGLWDDSGTLLAQALVTNSSTVFASQSSLGQWYVTQISDLVLSAGTYRVAGLLGSEANALANDKVSTSGVTLSSGYVRTDFPSGGFAFPNLSFDSNAIRASLTTGAFSEPLSVSAPSTIAIFALALMGLVSRKLKK